MKSVLDFFEAKKAKKKISMVTCYDFTSAHLLSKSPIDCILVGDSASMVMHGNADTLPIDITLMAHHVAAVKKGAPEKFVIGDIPFLAHRKSLDTNMDNVEKLMKAGSNAIKLEGAAGNLQLIEHIVQSGVPVMGHLGLTPQSVNQLGGYKVQGRNKNQAQLLFDNAKALQEAGCFSLVLECIPSALAAQVTSKLDIPTIGIGAGLDTDGQVLVMQDMLGLNKSFKPKFVRHYMNGEEAFLEAFERFHQDVVAKKFPSIEESYE